MRIGHSTYGLRSGTGSPTATVQGRLPKTGPTRDQWQHAPSEPLPVNVPSLFANRRSYAGSLFGGIRETQEMLDRAATSPRWTRAPWTRRACTCSVRGLGRPRLRHTHRSGATGTGRVQGDRRTAGAVVAHTVRTVAESTQRASTLNTASAARYAEDPDYSDADEESAT